MRNKWLIIGMLIWCVSSAKAQTSDVDKMFPNAVLARESYDKVIKALANTTDASFPKNWYVKQIETPANKIVENDRKTTPVKSIDDNPNKIDISNEMKSIHQLCLAYAFTQDKKYLDKAVEYLKAWSEINIALSKRNIHEEAYNIAVEGYSLIRKVIDPSDRELIDGWIRKRAEVFIKDNDLRVNNWGTCLLYQFYLLGTVLEDKAITDKFHLSYDEWVKNNLFPNGTTTDLLGRDAFAYHAYDLLFFARICHLKAMCEGYAAADAFYAKDVHWGASIRKSVNFWKPFLLDTKKYTHLEFVGTEYEPDKKRSDYNKAYSPSGTLYVVDELYEVDKELKEVLDQYKRNPDVSLKLGLSNLRWY